MSTVAEKPVEELIEATVRFCGDSGDGMQLAGTQFTTTSALVGNDVATFPDFPAEIRAPRGTKAGVSGFQVHFSSSEIYTPGDVVDALVAMNPAAFVTNIGDLRDGGILIVNESAFDKKGLELAGLEGNPIEEVALHQLEQKYKVYKVDMTKLTRDAVKEFGMGVKEADRCRNFFAMGLIFWVYGRPLEPTLRFIEAKFGKKPEIAGANRAALMAGYNYGETVEAFDTQFHVPKAELKPGKYRSIMGNTALSWGLMTAAKLSEKRLFLGAYPITPASDILHELCKHKNYDIVTFQAEDEIAAMTATIGAAFGGAMAITASSGPGIALKGEAFGLAVIMELPMVIINVQRGGPSTGLPTKTEQSDLYQAMYGRNGECPMPVIAARSPGDCFDVAQEAWRLAVRYMTPVMLLTDGYIANGSEPWRIPSFADLAKIPVGHPEATDGSENYLPYTRDERLARPWAIPGTPGLEHRLGGLEKQDRTGNVSYDPANHQHMVDTRAAKVANIAEDIPDQTVDGPDSGDLLVVSWGGTYGSCTSATRLARKQGKSVAHAHIRYLNPFPKNLGELMSRYKKVLVPELNSGQLRTLLRDEYLVDAIGFNKIQGRPFTVAELVTRIGEIAG
ncbi:2-oxoacid:acceptor oxidoreductase subunit alpha [Botrimarina mediterranea]|uniref:2-oxoglutarate oxidoreductase subunit KorA n=1 Tax=Botrimarina mediterranea TaxID=2528022 RepID=A0A518K4Y9_9BACT|nr:2-oxoacid:acceptor oxidoreductase subunit alpha [Botrimarina mediterranea]QDV72845.1 2-oxoglutarate oxidoreductase subunit KorA [Botrimarina mediterranea]QDV77417.1 2-oxoglutarate oxidoreductase subunit KorA [Planctomycetes bacterium K2D]